MAGDSVEIWRITRGSEVTTLGDPGAVHGAAHFSPHGRLLASVNAAEKIELRNVATRRRVRVLCCMALYGGIALSPDSTILAAAGHRPRLWDLRTGVEIRRLVPTRNPTFAAVIFSPDGSRLTTGDQEGRARLWDVATGKVLLEAARRPDYVETVAFHPDGPLGAYGLRDDAVWLWDTATGSEQRVADRAARALAFSPDGRWLDSCSGNRKQQYFDT